MRKFFTFLFLTFLTVASYGAPINVKQAKEAAISFLNRNFNQTKALSGNLELIWSDANALKAGSSHENASFYVFRLTDKDGFVVISGDDDVYPILGYSMQQTFRVDSMPSNLRLWFEGYQKQINWIRENKPVVSKAVTDAWAALSTGSFELKAGGNLLSTALWDQLTPYNNICPVVNGQKSLTGCVATATSIVMRYHKWPDTGQGNFSYTTATHRLRLSASFNTTFDWNNMPMQYITGQYTAQQASNVATLMYDCGVFSQMDYDPDNSGALTINAAMGLVNYMKYDKSLHILTRDNYQTNEWVQILNNEIDNNRPIMYGGQNSSNEGHQFIVDGYADSNYYHINWGWSGQANGYFLLDAFNPETQGAGVNSPGSFSIGQDAVIGIKKPVAGSSYQDVLSYFSGENNGVQYKGITTDASAIVPNTEFYVTAGFIGNFSIRQYNGLIAIALTDKNGNIKQIISPQENISLQINYGANGTFPCKITTSLSPDDRIRGIYKSSDSNTWQWIRGGGSTVGEILVSNPTANETIENSQSQVTVLYTSSDNIEVSAADGISTVSLFDLTGHILHKQTGNNNRLVTISANTYNKGLYILEVVTSKGRSTHKILKN